MRIPRFTIGDHHEVLVASCIYRHFYLLGISLDEIESVGRDGSIRAKGMTQEHAVLNPGDAVPLLRQAGEREM